MFSAVQPEIPDASGSVSVLVDVPDGFVEQVRYTIEMLLLPLGVVPRWEATGSTGLYYGPADGPEGWVKLAADSRAAQFFAGRKPAHSSEGTFSPDPDRDPVAASFYWLTGWDEWAVSQCDRFGRSRSEDSWLVKHGLERRAPVDEVRDQLAARMQETGIGLSRRQWNGRPFVLCPTHDVDYLKKWRAGILYREAVHYLIRNHRSVSFQDRLRRTVASTKSMFRPGDVFRQSVREMGAAVQNSGGTATWFFKAGHHGPHDVPYAIKGRAARLLIRQLESQGHEIGLHPSFHAFDHPEYLADERERLEAVCARPVRDVRTHYLRLDPRTPGHLADAGFQVDSTLGFSDRPGFRRGTCLPFRLWDHEQRAPLPLWEMPLAVMESALFNRAGLGLDGALAATREVMETARRHGGALVALWHNTLWDELDYPGWREHFLGTLEMAKDGALSGLSGALSTWAPETN